MKVSVDENKNIIIEEAYLPVVFESAEKERMATCMRDTGFEVIYTIPEAMLPVKFELKGGVFRSTNCKTEMTLGEFIKNFSHNNLIRLHYPIKGGAEIVHKSWDDVSMDHDVINGKGINRHYIDNKVIRLDSILVTKSHYPEALNIVIEKLENQPFIEENVLDNTNGEMAESL